MDARIVSNQVINSLQISVLKEVPSGNFNPGVNFLLKNISDIESAIIFWFKDVDCKAENKVVEYLGEY